MKVFLAVLLLFSASGCGLFGPAPVRYEVGTPYQSGGVWRYPREEFGRVETGLATVYGGLGWLSLFRRTANGEAQDQGAMAAGHPTLQMPAIALVTNLENGRQVRVRINDRGPAAPTRSLVVTRRVAALLGAVDPSAIRVRLEVLEAESRALAAGQVPETAAVAVVAAPTGGVSSESLALPAGAAQSGRVRLAPAGRAAVASGVAVAPTAVPLRLPEVVTQTAAAPGMLAIECGGFSSLEYARVMRGRLAELGAEVVTRYGAGQAFVVRVGRYASIAEAEAMLGRVLAAGAPDARIVVE